MESVTINILNPRAKRVLKELEEKKLISINPEEESFDEFLNRMRKDSDNAPTMEEITKEVEIVRAKRYASRKS